MIEQPLLSDFRLLLTNVISKCLKTLYETKHLYQSISIDIDAVKATVDSSEYMYDPQKPVSLEAAIEQIIADEWEADALALGRARALGGSIVAVIAPDVKLFCKQCNRIEAFNSLETVDFIKDPDLNVNKNSRGKTVQIFVFSFLCQSCKSVPEVFVVRREGVKLILSGRSPMENVEVPDVIPKQISKYYVGAVLAYQSGQTLPANFMLRVLIEQWIRFKTGEAQSREVDDILDKYMQSLGKTFTSQFPSLRVSYDRLSADIHGAVGDSELFEETVGLITEHFDARRIFKLT